AADHVLADVALEQPGERPAHAAGIHAREIGLGDQSFGAVAEPFVSGQQRAVPFPLAGLLGEPRPPHRERQRGAGGDQLARPVTMAAPVGARASLVAAPPERAFQLLLQQLLDERAHLAAHRLLRGIEPIAGGEWRWRCRPGWRSFLHGVGSLSILLIGTYAASANFHPPRDTTT